MSNAGGGGGVILVGTRGGKFKFSAQSKLCIAGDKTGFPHDVKPRWILDIDYWLLDIEIKLDYPQQQTFYSAHPQHPLFVCPNRL
jgi:hypothetical protein